MIRFFKHLFGRQRKKQLEELVLAKFLNKISIGFRGIYMINWCSAILKQRIWITHYLFDSHILYLLI